MATYLDNFSNQADRYAIYRPRYPQPLYDYLLDEVKARSAAWDCATGNGQVAEVLSHHFDQVVATDASAAQLAQAPATSKVVYSVSTAEQTPFPNHSFDCITVAQALHWFDFNRFYTEVRRVIKPGGLLATWGYGLVQSENETTNRLVREFYTTMVGKYWDAERKYVDDAYQTIPFPFRELPHPDFSIAVTWSLNELLGYLGTWSSVQKFIRSEGYNPVEAFGQQLEAYWMANEALFFPVFMRAGMVE